MADPRFFRASGPFKVAELAALTGARIEGPDGAADRLISDVAPLETADERHLSFLANHRYLAAFKASRAGAVFVGAKAVPAAPPGMVLLVAADPYMAYARAARSFHPPLRDQIGVAATAVIDSGATLGPDVSLGHFTVVGAGAAIGARSVIGPNSVIGAGVVLGEDCIVGANVTITHTLIGDRVIIYAGARIGQDGFGFASGADGHLRIPQLGRVIIGDDVEIGANTTIDRGAGPDTIIGAGAMIDNLVQIGHNTVIGRGCVIVAQAGLAGSVKLGDFVALGGQVGVAGHLTLAPGTRIAAKSGVMRDVTAPAAMGGIPAVPMTQWLRQVATLGRLVRKEEK
jgi:UDP-3-O-[3-hydroxymyristoyl] glucosamine N-acyltransferase